MDDTVAVVKNNDLRSELTTWKELFENGTEKKEYNWSSGKLDGKYVEWYESGQEKIEGEYDEDGADHDAARDGQESDGVPDARPGNRQAAVHVHRADRLVDRPQ